MGVSNDVGEARAIESIKLAFDPIELFIVARNIRVEADHERVAVSKRKHGIARQPARRTVGRQQFGIHRVKVPQPDLPLRVFV